MRFLTRIPIPGEDVSLFEQDLPMALQCFPLVGGLIGGASALVLVGASAWFPLALAATMAVAFEVGLTRGLHEDGLADLADGLGGGRHPEQTLRIMKDSRIGAFGALALGFAMALRVLGLIACGGTAAAAMALILSGAVARGVMLVVMATVPAREGLGAAFAAGMDVNRLARAVLLAVPLLLLFLGWHPVALFITVVIVTIFLTWYRALLMRRLGGANGDAIGAAGVAGGLICTLALAAR